MKLFSSTFKKIKSMAQSQIPQPSAPDLSETSQGGGEVEMQTLLSLPNTRAFTIQNGKRSNLGTGELNICVMDVDTLLLYIPNIFQYAISSQFPCLRASHLSFVFPGQNGLCFGLILSNSITAEDLAMFEGLLADYSQYHSDEGIDDEKVAEIQNAIQNTPNDAVIANEAVNNNAVSVSSSNKTDYEDKGKKVASYIQKGSDLAKKGIQKGTAAASVGIQKSNQFLKKKITSRKNVDVSPQTQARIEKAKLMSKSAVKVSKAVAVGAKIMCSELAASASDAAKQTEYGKKFAESESDKVKGAKEVGKATLTGFVEIWEELQNAALVLVSEAADSGADITRHKYGDSAGDAADGVADIVKDGSQVVMNVHDLGLKAVVKAVAVDGAVDMMSTEEEVEKNRKERRMRDLGGVDPDIKMAASVAKDSGMLQ